VSPFPNLSPHFFMPSAPTIIIPAPSGSAPSSPASVVAAPSGDAPSSPGSIAALPSGSAPSSPGSIVDLPAGSEPVAASVTITPTGTNNDIVVTAVDVGAAGNDLTIALAIDATTDRTQLSASEVAGDVVVTSGDKRRMLVSANFGTGVENHILTYVGIDLGAYQWNNTGTISPTEENAVRLEHAVNGTASYLLKIIDAFGEDSKFTVINPFVNWPDEVDWSTASTDDGATGTPTVTGSPVTAAQVIAAINADTDLSVAAANAAANDGTGAIAAVAATALTGGGSVSTPNSIIPAAESSTPTAPGTIV